MADRPPFPSDAARDAADGTPAPPHDRLDASIAAGLHDDALVRLGAAHLLADAESSVWSDAHFLAWWAEEQRAAADAVARQTSDATFLANGQALRAQVALRRLGVIAHIGAPPVRRAPVQSAPMQAMEVAARVRATPVVDLAVAAGVGRELWDEPVETWLDLPEGLTAGRYLALRIRGDSMEPAMLTGDTVLVALGATPKVGAAVVARHPDDGYLCKRVRRVRPTTVELESLAPDRPIITLPRRDDLVLGVVVALWREVGA